MGAIAIRCPECGATIPAPASAPIATCEYCGTRSQIRRRTGFLERPEAPTHLPRGAQPMPVAMQQHTARWRVSLFLIPLFVGGMIVFSIIAQRAAAEGPASLREPRADGTTGLAVVDVDGDGVLDLVGRAQVIQPEHRTLVAAWHGTTGKRMWITAPIGLRSDVLMAPLAVAGQVVLISDGRGGVFGFGLADGTPLWNIRLNEKVEEFCAGPEGVVRARTADDQLHPIGVADGAVQPSAGAGPCDPLPGDGTRGDRAAWQVWGWAGNNRDQVPTTKIDGMKTDEVLYHRASGVTIALGHKTPGSRVPMIAAFQWPAEDPVDIEALQRQSRETDDHNERHRLIKAASAASRAQRDRVPEVLWTAPVPGVDPLTVGERSPPATQAALDAETVVVAYDTRTTHEYRVAAFRVADGRRLWDVALPGTMPMSVVALSPTHAIVSRWTGRYAFDRATGKLAFTIP